MLFTAILQCLAQIVDGLVQIAPGSLQIHSGPEQFHQDLLVSRRIAVDNHIFQDLFALISWPLFDQLIIFVDSE